jgi:TolB-like protein
MRLLLPLLLSLTALSVRAEAPPVPIAVLQLEAEAALEPQARSVTALLASHLAETPGLRVLTSADVQAMVGLARQRELLGEQGCVEGRCASALADATGARYVVTGRLDRHGERYVLTTSLLDSVEARPLARPRAEAASEAALPEAASDVAEQLLGALRTAPGTPLPFEGEWVAGLRVNNSFVSRLRALNPGGEVELGYRFHPEWQGFVQVGLSFVRKGGDSEEAGRLNVVPSVLGVRHFHRIQHALQPYWGLGLGLQLSFGQYGVFRETGTLPTVIGFAGLEYRVGRHLGLQLETGTNVAQALLGLSENGLGDGLNLDLNAGLAWHF